MNAKEIWRWWQVNSFLIEIRVRRLKRAQRWARDPKWYVQELASHFGQFVHEQIQAPILIQGQPTRFSFRMVRCLLSDFRYASGVVDGFGDCRTRFVRMSGFIFVRRIKTGRMRGGMFFFYHFISVN